MSLLRSVATVSGFTFLSRILGFVRDFVIARSFGADAATDAFFVAFKLPNLLRRMFAEGAFSQAFVPLLGEYHKQRGEAETRQLINRSGSALGAVVLLVAILGIWWAPAIVTISAPGFLETPDKFELAVTLTRITFLYIFFMSMVAFAAGILNTWSHFSVPAFTPVLLNVSLILMAAFTQSWFDPPVKALAWGVILGGILQLGLQFYALHRIDLLPKFSLNLKACWQDPGVKRIGLLMVPALLGVSVSQISLLLNTVFASFLESGSISWLYYADRLMEFPAGMLGVAIGTVILPSLTRHHHGGDKAAYSSLLDWGLRLCFLLTLPAALGLAILAVPLISTLFMHGAFTAHDVSETSHALIAYSVGLSGLILVKVLAPGFYARQNLKTPVKIAIIALVSTQLMNLAFIAPFKQAGLALSIGLAACLNAALLYRGLRQAAIYEPMPGWTSFITKLCIALAVMAGILFAGYQTDTFWLEAPLGERVLWLSGLIAAASGAYGLTLFLLGFRPRDFRKT
jgi:putative peptidoglycan lipid II flippase